MGTTGCLKFCKIDKRNMKLITYRSLSLTMNFKILVVIYLFPSSTPSPSSLEIYFLKNQANFGKMTEFA